MSKKFDVDGYVSRWDDKLIPIMLVFIVGAMIAVYALNVWARPACTTHDYVFCGTPLDMPAEEEAHGGGHAPAGHGEEGADHGHSHGGEAEGHGAEEAHGHPH
ncbi:MAG: hypothetical protein EOP07_09885 [Proteobacteria bacterium]|nr:MAG: hypothetical protein EOP07_09885 [Pseudomonadota bacterium]